MGIVMYSLLYKRHPFCNEDNLFDPVAYMNADFNFCSPYPPDHAMFNYFNGISDLAKDLICMMINVNAGARPSASDALRHPWFKKYGDYSKLAVANSVSQIANEIEGTMYFQETEY